MVFNASADIINDVEGSSCFALFLTEPDIFYIVTNRFRRMAGASFALKLSAIILVIIGGWFIVAALLPMFEIYTDWVSPTVVFASLYLYLSGYITNPDIIMWIFPVLGVLGFLVGFLLLSGKGRFFGFVAYGVTLTLAVLGAILIFGLIGVETPTGMWETVVDAIQSGDILTTLSFLIEPLLIIVGSVVGMFMLMIGKTK